MSFMFGSKSSSILCGVHPRMQAVAHRAIQISEVDFAVVQGRRTVEEQQRLYGKGRTAAQLIKLGIPAKFAVPGEAKVTWTMKSRHLSGNAIDVAPYVNGKLEWDDNGKLGLWPKIAAAFKNAAAELNIEIQWGGDWQGTKDRPHFELLRP